MPIGISVENYKKWELKFDTIVINSNEIVTNFNKTLLICFVVYMNTYCFLYFIKALNKHSTDHCTRRFLSIQLIRRHICLKAFYFYLSTFWWENNIVLILNQQVTRRECNWNHFLVRKRIFFKYGNNVFLPFLNLCERKHSANTRIANYHGKPF